MAAIKAGERCDGDVETLFSVRNLRVIINTRIDTPQ